MITENMQLTTARDAEIWAGQMGLSDEQSARLADWIWDNKPHAGCTYNEHPISSMEIEEFWEITDPQDEE